MREEGRKKKESKREERRGKEGEGEGLMQEMNSQHSSGVQDSGDVLEFCFCLHTYFFKKIHFC